MLPDKVREGFHKVPPKKTRQTARISRQTSNPVAEWTKGTALKPLLDALEGEQRRDFEAAYRARVAEAYPPTATGQTLFPFRRLFLIAQRGLDA